MKYEVEFTGLDFDASIARGAVFKHGNFIYGKGGSVINPEDGLPYPPVKGVVIRGEIERPEKGRELYDPLDAALYLAEEIITGIVATTQTDFSWKKPIKCMYLGVEYEQDGGFWREPLPPDNVITGGEAFVKDLSYLDIEKNFHPKYHFYRVFKDDANNIDYRLLNGWRFLEAHYGLQGRALILKLNKENLFKGISIESVYNYFRCAIAHASMINTDMTTDKVILPNYYETTANGNMYLLTRDLSKAIDKIVKEQKPIPMQNKR